MGNISDSPLTAGLSYRMGTCADSSIFVQFQAVKLTATNTYAPCGLSDTDAAVAGICLIDRNPGDPLSIPVCYDFAAHAVPVLTDGSATITPGSSSAGFLTLSGASAGRFKKTTSVGFLFAVTGAGAVADGVVMAQLNGANAGSASGSVTSVGLAVPAALLTVSGSPVTTAGTITTALATQAKNLTLVGPASGANAAPTFRQLTQPDMTQALGWFDITDAAYGAVGDATLNTTTGVWTGTDNSTAILNTIKAAVAFSQTFGNRFGTVYFPPCAAGKGYLITSEVTLALAQNGLTSGSSLHLRLLGCGADGPIVVGTADNTKYGINITATSMEWFQGVVENLCFTQTPLIFGAHAACKAALRLGTTVGRWVVRDLQAIGVWGKLAIFHFSGGNFSISDIEDSGCTTGADPSGVAAFIYMDEAQVFNISGVFSYSEFNYLGFDNGITSGAGLGLQNALIAVNASTDANWGPTVGVLERIYGTTRDGYLVYAYPTTGAQRMASLVLRNFTTKSATPGAVTAGYIDSVKIEDGSWAAGASYYILDAYSCTRCEVRNVITQAGQTVPKLRADNACGVVEIENCPGMTSITVTSPAIARVSSSSQKGLTVGAALTVSSNTIAPIHQVHNVGAGLIKTITVPFTGFTGTVILIPTAAFTYDATGNILANAGMSGNLAANTAVIGIPMRATYNGTKWAMSY